MSYTPPSGSALSFSFQDQFLPLHFAFIGTTYSPPSESTIPFNFLIPTILLDFHWAPIVAPPITKELISKLGIRFHGQVYKYWVGYVRLGKQCFRRYWEINGGHTEHLSFWKDKFRQGVKAWHNLSDFDKLYWHRVGARKLKPITSLNAFLSAFMRDKL